MPKNIVICCDGTGNEFGDQNSNVVKLHRALERNGTGQVGYYHPGVGTMGAKGALSAIGKWWTKVRGLAFGYGLSENIADAYRFLMHIFQPGDQVFIFGFSRGAYTARALCGLLQMFGLLSPGNEGLIPYALRLFKKGDRRWGASFRAATDKFDVARQFKSTFSVECRPHFLGLWDTVSSVGWVLDPFGLKPGRLPYTAKLQEVEVIRHAMSLDERRAFFRQNLVSDSPGRDLKQVWFAGVHSDVGGSYPEAESGLSKITLRWMIGEAQTAGLRFDPVAVAETLGGHPRSVRPSPYAEQHNSLGPAWWIGEFWPKWTKKLVSAPGTVPAVYRGSPRINLFSRRHVSSDACFHESVLVRRKALPKYTPINLPEKPENVEPDPALAGYPVRLAPGQRLTVGVHARAKWNDTAVRCEQGEAYRFEASGEWRDATNKHGPAGSPSSNLLFRCTERWRRAPSEKWFALIGALDRDSATAFTIGAGRDWPAPRGGILYCFANDISFMYGNNTGWVSLTITRL